MEVVGPSLCNFENDAKDSGTKGDRNVECCPSPVDEVLLDLETLVTNVLTYFDELPKSQPTNSNGHASTREATTVTFTDSDLDDLVEKICSKNESLIIESSSTVKESDPEAKSFEETFTPKNNTEDEGFESMGDDTQSSELNFPSDCDSSVNGENNIAKALEILRLRGMEMVYTSGDECSDSDDDEPWRLLKPVIRGALLLSRPLNQCKGDILDMDVRENISSASGSVSSPSWDGLDIRSEACLNICKNFYMECSSKSSRDRTSVDLGNETDSIKTLKCPTTAPQEEFIGKVEGTQSSVNTLQIQKSETATHKPKLKQKTAIRPKRLSQFSPDITEMVVGSGRRKCRSSTSNVRASRSSIPYFSFCKLVKQITYQIVPNSCSNLRYKVSAINTLHQAAYAVLCGAVEDRYFPILDASPFQKL